MPSSIAASAWHFQHHDHYRPGGNTANSSGNNGARGCYCSFEVVPEPETVVALVAGLGAIAARPTAKVIPR